MNTGQVISGIGHAGLIGWLLLGGSFQSDPAPIEVTEVSVISSDVFEALLTNGPQPDSATEVALPVQPDITEDPVATPVPDQAVATPVPEAAPQPTPEVVPDIPAPIPDPQITDTAPAQPQPQEQAVPVPDVAPRPIPRPSERVAPKAVAPPPEDVAPSDVEQPAISEADGGETPAEPQDATAPEEAATEIVTEAEQPTNAPNTSMRPPSARPSPPVRTAEPEVPEPVTPDPVSAAVEAAVDEAINQVLNGTATDATPTGPPLTSGEKDALRVAVSSCWNVGSLSSDALLTTVVVKVDMTPDGKPVNSSIRMVSSSGGSAGAANQAFEAARRAIIRCTRDGYALPAEKYGQWKEIEMTFNPERMRIK